MNNKFMKNVFSLFSGTMVSQLLVVVSSPILTRIYTLEQFGQLAIFTSILSIFTSVLSFRYEMAFINIKNRDSKLHLLKMLLIFIISTSFTVVLTLILLDSLSILSYFDYLSIYLLLWMSLIGIGLYNALSYFAISDNRINKISLSKIQQASSLVFIQIASGLLNIKNGLILGDSISRISGIIILLKQFTKNDYNILFKAHFKDIFNLLKVYKDYAKYSVASGVSNNFVMQSLPLILAIFYAQPLIGVLSIIQRVLVMPIKVISQSVRQAFINEIMSHIQTENFILLKKFITKIVTIMFIISIIPFVIGVFYGEKLLIFLLGPNLENSSSIINALLILSAFQFIFLPINQTLDLIKKQNLQFKWQIARFLLVLLTLIVLPTIGSSFHHVLYAYVMLMSIFYVLQYLIIIHQLRLGM